MNTNANININTNIITESTKCKNKSFRFLEEEFIKKNWLLQVNEEDHIVFQSPSSNYDYFEIKIDQITIYVTVPLKNSKCKYMTQFKTYFQASEFVEMHLNDFTSL